MGEKNLDKIREEMLDILRKEKSMGKVHENFVGQVRDYVKLNTVKEEEEKTLDFVPEKAYLYKQDGKWFCKDCCLNTKPISDSLVKFLSGALGSLELKVENDGGILFYCGVSRKCPYILASIRKGIIDELGSNDNGSPINEYLKYRKEGL